MPEGPQPVLRFVAWPPSFSPPIENPSPHACPNPFRRTPRPNRAPCNRYGTTIRQLEAQVRRLQDDAAAARHEAERGPAYGYGMRAGAGGMSPPPAAPVQDVGKMEREIELKQASAEGGGLRWPPTGLCLPGVGQSAVYVCVFVGGG